MKNKIFILLIMSIFQWTFLVAQKNGCVGLAPGAAVYLGDANQGGLIQSPGLSINAFYKHDINKRYALKIMSGYHIFEAEPINDIKALFEISYFEFERIDHKKYFTPYMTAGLGAAIQLNNPLVIPFGLGFKLSVSHKVSLGAEYLMHKTFVDNFEVENASNTNNGNNLNFHNNDYYSTLNIFITYKFFKFADNCPVY